MLWGWGLGLLVVLGNSDGNWDDFCLLVRTCEKVWIRSDMDEYCGDTVSVAFGCGGT